MHNLFFNLDNSTYSKLIVYLLQYESVPQTIYEISHLSGVTYEKAKFMTKKMWKFGILNRYNSNGFNRYSINSDSEIAKTFKAYHKSVIDKQIKKYKKYEKIVLDVNI